MEYKFNENRLSPEYELTGIYIRAKKPDGSWDNADLLQLERESVINWTNSRENGAIDALLIMLGYKQTDK